MGPSESEQAEQRRALRCYTAPSTTRCNNSSPIYIFSPRNLCLVCVVLVSSAPPPVG
jgi:hypothetical protein